MNYQSEIDIISNFLEAVRDELILDLDQNNRNATGRTRQGIYVSDVTRSGGRLYGPAHILYTFQGRGPGKMPPLFNIIQWCVARNIPRSRAYIIAKNIKENGTRLYRMGARGDNALSRVTSQKRIEELTKQIITSITDRFRFGINELIAA